MKKLILIASLLFVGACFGHTPAKGRCDRPTCQDTNPAQAQEFLDPKTRG